ncbi:glycosyltransferase [Chromobacterium paludis]|uniref:Glycosyltransferase n=1 Tax=Chromobacterium paludis TaxID=2605945 RepID=A0A5C1DKW3_9NEIS|nr:glycosyltransferase [Chromobacterium paludis]QEL56619.1 glycosyltransferase [Chromobacterium paludis]
MSNHKQLFAPLGAPYYFFIPPFRETSGGVRALHYLCHVLNVAGQEAYVVNPGTSPNLRTPVLSAEIRLGHQKAGREAVVVYPEVVHGNPLGARFVVRFLLNIPGFLVGAGLHELDWSESDLIYSHGLDIIPDGWDVPLLQVPLIDTRIYNSEGVDDSKRKGTLLWLHRYPQRGGEQLPITRDAYEISFKDGEKSPVELAELYRSAELLYTYEHTTACFEALLCGCPVVYLPNPQMLPKPMHSYFGDDGTAWGHSPAEIAKAKATVGKVWGNYQGLQDVFWDELEAFIERTQHHVAENTRAKSPSTDLTNSRKPKIGVFTRDLPDMACFRLRIWDPIQLMSPYFELCFHVGMARNLLEAEYPYETDDAFIADMDMFLVQRAYPMPETRALLDRAVSSRKPVIYETDDWLLDIPESHPQFDQFETSFDHIKWMLEAATLVTVPAETLAAKIRPFNPRVFVFPNALSEAHWVDPLPRSEQVVIGFAGTSTRTRENKLLNAALARIHNDYAGRVKFVMWGMCPPELRGKLDVMEVSSIVSFCEFYEKLAHYRIDIGLAPLFPGSFNEGKSDLKWVDYSVVGACTVASDVGSYAWLKNSGMATVLPNDADAWYEAIANLIENPELRTAQTEAAREYLLRNRTLEKVVASIYQQWRELLPQFALPASMVKLGEVNDKSLSLLSGDELKLYNRWVEDHQLREVHAEEMAERMMTVWQRRPMFNLLAVVPKDKLKRLSETLDALQKQLYPNWRLIILAETPVPDPVFESSPQLGWLQLDDLNDPEAFAGVLNGIVADVPADWIWLLPAGFRLEPGALLRIAEGCHQHPEWMAVYCDSDVVSPMGRRFKPLFRPDFSPEYLRSMDYIGDALLFSAEAVAKLGGFQPYPGAYCYDLLLRLTEDYPLECVGHIDDMLLSLPWGGDKQNRILAASKQVVLENHASRCGLPVKVSQGLLEGTYNYEYLLQKQSLISVIIPNRDKLEYLQPCVDTLFSKTAYQNFELIIVDNQSELPETLDYYQELQDNHPGRVRIVAYDAPFNFSAQCNLGVQESSGDYILLLNNDTEVVQPQWLERMLAAAQQPGVGAVGARLLFPGAARVQHAGIVLGMPGGLFSVAGHAFVNQPMDDPGYMNRAVTMQNYSAVTAACLLVSKSLYLDVGGMDETEFKVCFNDVDFCLKILQKGWRNVYLPQAVVCHHHARSITVSTSDPRLALRALTRERDELERFLRKWMPMLRRDPAYNRNLALTNPNMLVEVNRTTAWVPDVPGRKRIFGMPVPGGSGEYRLSQPLTVLQQQGKLDGEILQPNRGVPSLAEMARLAPDTLLLHIGVQDVVIDAMAAYREYLPQLRLMLGLDDLVGGLPEKSNLHEHWRRNYPDAKARLRKVLQSCHGLIVSTEPLVDFARGMVDEIFVVPNRLRKEAWGDLHSARRNGRKPRVGWVGAAQHRGDLELLHQVIEATHEEVEWVFMGMSLPQFRDWVKEVHPFVSFEEYPKKMASLNLDLAVAPLEINPFNEAKSNLRLLEYGAAAWPVICSDIFPYQTNDAPVCRVPNEAKAWIKAIRERVHDLDAAAKEGDTLREWVRKHYWLEEHNDDWCRALIG